MPRMEDPCRSLPRKDDGGNEPTPIPSKPTGATVQVSLARANAYTERHNHTVRGELPGQNIFETIEAAQEQATEWLWAYDNERPNIATGSATPAMKLKTAA